jgi:hypothetical protein
MLEATVQFHAATVTVTRTARALHASRPGRFHPVSLRPCQVAGARAAPGAWEPGAAYGARAAPPAARGPLAAMVAADCLGGRSMLRVGSPASRDCLGASGGITSYHSNGRRGRRGCSVCGLRERWKSRPAAVLRLAQDMQCGGTKGVAMDCMVIVFVGVIVRATVFQPRPRAALENWPPIHGC